MKVKIVADAHIPFLKGVAEQFGEVEYLPGNQFTRETIREKDALIVRTVTHFGEEIRRRNCGEADLLGYHWLRPYRYGLL